MDIPSAASFALAETIASCWFVDEIADAGAVIELQRVWMRPSQAHDGLWARVANYFINGLYSKDSALLVLKAFPLEYESEVKPDVAAAFELRRRAMFRHYRRHLGVELLPGWAGDDGWMWRALKKAAPSPAQLD